MFSHDAPCYPLKRGLFYMNLFCDIFTIFTAYLPESKIIIDIDIDSKTIVYLKRNRRIRCKRDYCSCSL